VIQRHRTILILGLVAGALLVAVGTWAVAAALFNPPGQANPAAPGKGIGPGDEGGARPAMRAEAAILAHRFWRKSITADRLNELLTAISSHDNQDGDLFIDRDGGLEVVPHGGRPQRLSKPSRSVEFGPERGHPDRRQGTAILRETLDRAEREYGAGR
jgi:hypothetical protein